MSELYVLRSAREIPASPENTYVPTPCLCFGDLERVKTASLASDISIIGFY